MDEGDRPETDRDPAERSEGSDEERTDRDEPESDSLADTANPESDDRADTPESVVPAEESESADASNPTDPADISASAEPTDTVETAEPTDTVETAEPINRDPFTGGDGRESERTVREDAGADPTESEGLVYRFRHDKEGALMWIREMLSSVAIVLAIGLLLFGVSGVWPPMVAVESGSMEPNMEVGDLVFVTEPGRFAPDAANNDIGVVTHEGGQAAGYQTFGSYGSVVIYRPPGRTASPIIHRAMFHVEEDENWYDRADEEYHSAEGCTELRHCPAPNKGFITLGDNNGAYDQANGLAPPVRAEWVTGVARVRIPYLGYVRLIASGQAELSDVLVTTVTADSDSVDGRETVGGYDGVDWLGCVGGPTISGGGSVASVSG
ncbi:S26 family signal peptidase [Halorubrum sp. Boch-26]|uniref:S26 family signal peptidase n=1 Tax=Halorubrum sp. Boch-26 TaxID=2994426 RepID=UPI0024684765|nr:S26 family signal peptidase [Halorubrum sp. Boch-26]